ncbi:N-alpha-acetyltransferase 35, NatC auxiliary subunit [Manis javanica]|nr:N-alpha-acetyltransferase 35, NatC auxiliary subunit [Manis javanica]
MLGPHLDVSSSAVTGRHSKNQWYQHRFISWKQDFEEGLPPPYHCLGITTMAELQRHSSHLLRPRPFLPLERHLGDLLQQQELADNTILPVSWGSLYFAFSALETVDCWREALRGIREETPARNSLEALDNFPLSPMIHIARPSCSGRPYDASQKSDHGLSITQQILEGKTDIQNVAGSENDGRACATILCP